MFCPKCNTKLPIESKFCVSCGEKIIGETTENLNAKSVEQENKKIEKVKKLFANKKIAVILLVIIVCVILVLGISGLLNVGSNNAYVYLSDGKYQLLKDIETGQSVEISSSKSEDVRDEFVSFSPTGKYVYYYTKYDSSSQTGTLCRVKYNKLKENSSENSNYIEIIDTNVSLGFTFVSDDSILYKSGTDSLYYYDKETIQISKNIKDYYLEGKKVIYYTGNNSDGYQIYGTTLDNPDDKKKLVSHCDEFEIQDLENILYTKKDEAGTQTLYKVGYSKELEKLAENATFIKSSEGIPYFTANNGAALSLLDFVVDNCAEQDAMIEKPEQEDFEIPQYTYRKVTGSDLTVDEFDELYTSCTKPLYWFRNGWFSYYSMDEAVDMDWGEKTESIRRATQSFIDKFGDRANEDGYILVTNEVREALKEIQKYADSPEKEWQWMWLCYSKRESGTTIDYDAYNEAYEKWNEASARNTIRENLHNNENDFQLKTLYCYEDGKFNVVAEDVVDVSVLDNAILFNTKDQIDAAIQIEELSSIDDVYSILDVYSSSTYNIILANGTTCKMSIDAAETLADSYATGYAKILTTDKEVFLNDANKCLYRATVEKGMVGDFVIVSDDAEITSMEGNTLYYAENFYKNNYTEYCDLYSLENGKVTCRAKDILPDLIVGYRDGVIVACTGCSKYNEIEMTIIDEAGQTTIIGEDVSQLYRVDKSMWLYINGGDLYSYDGKEKKLLQIDVDWIWSKDYMEEYKLYNSYF